MSFQRDFLAKRLRDPQAKLVHDLAQIQANVAAENVSFITSNLKGYAIKVGTKTTSKDKYYLNMHDVSVDKNFYTGRYPDYDNCRLFIRTENAGDLHDYSLMDNEAFVYGTRQVPEIYIKEDPDDPAGHEFVAYFNGTHYVIVKDHSRINMKSIVTNEPTKSGFSFIRRWNPMKAGNSVQDSICVAQKTDTSQNQYGYSLNLDDRGNFYFYVKYNYRQYFVKLSSNISLYTTTGANFFFENFNPANFKTEAATVEALTRYNLDIACTFNFVTKEAVVELRRHDAQTNQWFFVGRASSVDQIIPNCQINLPLQEGKWSAIESTPLNQVYDISANNFVGTINNPNNSARWEPDNTFYSYGADTNSTNITIPNHANINNLTEFTLAFWIKIPYTDNANYINVIKKGSFSNTYFLIEKQANSRDLKFWMRLAAGSEPSVIGTIDNDGWNFVVCKWKTGENLKISINNSADVLSSATLTGTFTDTNSFTIFDSVKSDDMSVINLQFFSRQINSIEQDTLYAYKAHLAQFPESKEPQISPSESLPPVTVPYSLLYDMPRITVPTLSNYILLNNPSAENPFIPRYNCGDGVGSTTALTQLYNIASGSGGTTVQPFVEQYNLAGASSTGNLQNNETAYVQRIQNVTSALNGDTITKIQVWLDSDGDADGSVYLGVVKSNGTYTKFSTAIDASTLGSGWVSFTKELTTNTVSIGLNDGVAVIWENNNNGTLFIRRAGTGGHDDVDGSGNPLSYQFILTGTSWNTGNDDFSMAGTFWTGGNTTGTTPWQTMSSQNGFTDIMGEQFGSTATFKDKPPTEAYFKVYKKASTTGTLTLAIYTSAGVLKTGGTLKTWNIASDPTITTTDPGTTFNLQYVNHDNVIQIASSDRLVLVVSGMNVGGELYVMCNIGNTSGNDYNSTTSYMVKRNRSSTGSISWSTHSTLDITAQISTGGDVFVPYKRFSATLTRIYEKAVTSSSSFKLTEPITQVKVRARRVGTIPGTTPLISCNIRTQTGVLIETMQAKNPNTAVGTVLADLFFEKRGSTYLIQPTDYISIELSGCDGSNYVELNINNNVADGTNSVLGVFDNSVHTDLANYDLAGTFFSGGQIDSTSRTRVGQHIDTQNSLFITAEDNSITYMELAMIKVGAPSGNFFVNIRNEDDAAVKTLAMIPASGLSSTVNSPTIVFVNDLANRYILRPKDKIMVEYDGGDTSNRVGVMVRTSSPNYDSTNSYVVRYNSIEYDNITTQDLVATIKVGGYTYTPDAGSLPPNMPQLSTDLYLGVSGDKEGLYEKSLSDLFLFTTEILTTQQLDNFIRLRVDIEDAEPHELLVTHHTFVNAE